MRFSVEERRADQLTVDVVSTEKRMTAAR
jgi:hypothetical protein